MLSEPSWPVFMACNNSSLAAADLADDDAVGTHAQGVADQIPNPHLAAPLHVGRAGLEGDHVGLRQPQLGGG